MINPIGSFRKTVGLVLRFWGIQERSLRLGTRRIHFYEAGTQHPQSVILLHGFGGNALFTWMRLLPALGKHFHVIAPDLLASNLLRLNPRVYSIDSEVKLVLALLQSQNISQTDLVGLSVGGWVSLLLALEHPEKIRRLVLVESAGVLTEVPELARLTLTDRATAQHFLNLLFHRPPPLPGFVLDALVAESTRIKSRYETIFAAFIENSKHRLLDNRLHEIQHPTLVIHGRQDRVIPLEAGERIHLGLPHSTMIILEESGHAPVWDSPQLLKKHILDFLLSPNPVPTPHPQG